MTQKKSNIDKSRVITSFEEWVLTGRIEIICGCKRRYTIYGAPSYDSYSCNRCKQKLLDNYRVNNS